MPHVCGHYRRDGSYVRPHYRRSRGSTGTTAPSRPAPYPRATPTVPGPTTRVRSHVRSNGSYVRAHRRRIGTPAKVAGGGGGAVLLVLLMLGLLNGGGTESSPVPDRPESSASAPARSPPLTAGRPPARFRGPGSSWSGTTRMSGGRE
ncbi:hypothetical protein [Streptomyces poonensis]|uniref:Uncharacterized protein n=1 Tax=Streptomyces poonensis TaxID=68255 RepID=A0A918QBD5_9ACTN|nr:hypothetical protein [Streptomyces poonensis]GGZ38107.1 hypothetical protein GCM10010365_68630 [Streptomyces poonensis]GLJ91077.1 hypothetical protein GCM10017589_36830 [Streptomyces poonensis]